MSSPFTQPDFTSQGGTAYKTNIDNAIACFKRIGGWFAPQAQSSPNMTIRLNTGWIWNGNSLTEVIAQNTATITAPVNNERIDRVVVDELTGVVSIITGTAANYPSAPAITAGKIPICQIYLYHAQATIVNADITDERPFISTPGRTNQEADATLNGNTVTCNMNLGEYRKITATGNGTIDVTPITSRPGTYVVELVNGGAYTITFSGIDYTPDGDDLDLTASGTDLIGLVAEDGGGVFGFVMGSNFS